MASPTTQDWGNFDMPSLADLIRMGKQYIGDAMPGGSLNPETAPVARQANYLSGILDPASQVSQDATNWHKRTQIGLKDQLAGRQTPEAEQAYQTMMMAAGMAPIGMTAWHGSPHKFDKFSLDKIGTGEGAQAYGHGLYLAESPEVAMGYRDKLQQVAYSGNKIDPSNPAHVAVAALERYGDKEKAAQYLKKQAGLMDYEINTQAAKLLDSGGELPNRVANGQLYKTDIPDEAVARFLDWDKPLSQQAPEVQAAIGRLKNANPSGYQKLVDAQLGGPLMEQATGRDLYQSLGRDAFNDSGIPGIRYLDGGSRSAGQGSSNFVAFDPEMIRILERNGQATGLEPWKPGEYRLKDLIGKE